MVIFVDVGVLAVLQIVYWFEEVIAVAIVTVSKLNFGPRNLILYYLVF